MKLFGHNVKLLETPFPKIYWENNKYEHASHLSTLTISRQSLELKIFDTTLTIFEHDYSKHTPGKDWTPAVFIGTIRHIRILGFCFQVNKGNI